MAADRLVRKYLITLSILIGVFSMQKLFILVLLTLSVEAFALSPMEEAEDMINSGLYNIDFRAGNGRIYCGGDAKVSGLAQGVSCLTEIKGKPVLPRPNDCDLEWGGTFFLGKTGKADMVCHSDFPFNPKGRILKDGETVKGNGWQCTASSSKVICSNQDKHGFEISQKMKKLF